MIKITPQQLDEVKQQLNDDQMRSHFVIFETYDPSTGETLRMITDYQSYLRIKKQRGSETPMRIVRDIVPVSDDLAMWAISENEAAQMRNSKEVANVLDEIDYYINKVLEDNKLPANK